MTRRAARLGCVGGVCLSALALLASDALGFTYDARRMGMASVQAPGSRELMSRNVAYQSMPARRIGSGFVVPIPLGLAQLASDFPPLDPDDADFSVTRLANTALNPPFFMELGNPSELDGDISVFVARNEFSVDFEDAANLLPQTPFDVGTVWAPPLAAMRVQNLRAYTGPLVLMEGKLSLDDAFYGVLAEGESLLPNSTYHVNAGGESMAGMVMGFGMSSAVTKTNRGDGMYAGAYMKYMLGFAMAMGESEFAMTTGDTIFGSGNPLDVGYDAQFRYADFGNVGNGVGFDAGLGYRRGAMDYGVGLRDLGSRIYWSNTTLERSFYNETSDEIENYVVEQGASWTQKLPTQATFNVAWTGRKAMLAGDVTTSRYGTELHVGGERIVGPLALRTGLRTDTETRLQYAGGIGLGFSRMWLDFGLETHNRSFTGERGVTLGTSLSLR